MSDAVAATGRLGWGIIGVGDVTERKSGPAFSRVPGSALVAVMRRDGARAADYARRHGVPRSYDDADALLADPAVDAVYVATPPDTHAEYAIRAAAAGKPVYVEKPMARTVAECDAMIAACDAAGVGLYVAYYRRCLPRFEAARRAVADGSLGAVGSVTLRMTRPAAAAGGWRVRPEVSGGGLFVDLGSHALDWLDWTFGPLRDVAGVASGPAGPVAETRVSAVFGCGDGIVGTASWDFTATEVRDEVSIEGDRARLTMSVFGDDPPLVHRGGRTAALTAAEAPESVQQPLIANVVDAIAGRAEPISTGLTARRTGAVIDRILAGHRCDHGLPGGR